MAHHAETNLNFVLADILQEMAPKSDMKAENTRVLREGMSYQPDILIAASGRSPVIIEAEYEPARSVEEEAKQRLGAQPEGQDRPVEAVVALRYPTALKAAGDVKAEMKEAALQYCFFQEADEAEAAPTRFPETGWLEGTAEDLSDLIRMISVPQKEVDRAAEALENSIERAAKILDTAAKERLYTIKEIARVLGMANVPQTRRMACAIIANALAFHERVSGMHDDIQPLNIICAPDALTPAGKTLEVWNEILKINYYPIFAIARDVLRWMPAQLGRSVLLKLRAAAEGAHMTNAHELTGRVFQRLISDRKYLATFYTRPHSAALLARLAVSKLRGVNWKNRESIAQLRIADFACGTGALLSAVYDVIASKHEREGGNADDLHPVMMEKVLRGCDVMPSAAHIASATLSGVRPEIDYGDSKIYTVPYGRQKDNTVKLGSLELLTRSGVITLFNTTDPGRATGRHGEQTATRLYVEMKNDSFDLVIMNPPFTTSTNHAGAHADVVNPAFAAFNATKEDMDDMRDRMKAAGKDTCYHGSAGMGSAFAALGDKKLRPGGVLALVLPLTAVSGKSWEKMRKMFAERYSEIDILSIAAPNTDEVSFSADTDMAECLIIARKERSDTKTPTAPAARFTALRQRPKSFVQASETANQIVKLNEARRIEDGPYGGSSLKSGEELLGRAISMVVDRDGSNWAAARIEDYSIAQTAVALTQSKLWLPGIFDPFALKTSTAGQIGNIGYVHRAITGPSPGRDTGKPPLGPFDKLPYSPTATYPSLWSHNALKETRIVCQPDSELQVRQGMEIQAAKIWATASRCHQNLDFRYNSQPLSVAFTERKTIGGTAWPNVLFEDNRFDYAFAIWGNSSLGLIMHWWHASRQQPGRGRITVTTAKTMPTLDLRALSDDQLSRAEDIFERFRDREFKPAYIADLDQSRADLDRAVLCELLGFDEAVYEAVRKLSAKWAAEPSVRGGKRRP